MTNIIILIIKSISEKLNNELINANILRMIPKIYNYKGKYRGSKALLNVKCGITWKKDRLLCSSLS